MTIVITDILLFCTILHLIFSFPGGWDWYSSSWHY